MQKQVCYLDVDLGSLEPFVGIDEEPDHDENHWHALDKLAQFALLRTGTTYKYHDSPVHAISRQVGSIVSWEAENGHHNQRKRAGDNTTRNAELSKAPRSGTKVVPDKGDLDEDGKDKGNVGSNGANGKDGRNASISSE